MVNSAKINLAIGFVAAYFSLFLSASRIIDHPIVIVVKIYALLSAALFFIFLLFSAIECQRDGKPSISIGLGMDTITLTEKDLKKICDRSFGAGINCLFYAGCFAPSFALSIIFTDHLNVVPMAVLVAIISGINLQFFDSIFKFKIRGMVFWGTLLVLFLIFSWYLDQRLEKLINASSADHQPSFEGGLVNQHSPVLSDRFLYSIFDGDFEKK